MKEKWFEFKQLFCKHRSAKVIGYVRGYPSRFYVKYCPDCDMTFAHDKKIHKNFKLDANDDCITHATLIGLNEWRINE